MDTNPVLIIRIQAPNQFRRIARDLNALFADYLRRTKEPFTVEQQWDALAHALAQGEGTLFLVAFDQKVRPIGYLLAQSGTDYWQIVAAFVRQLYIKPGSPWSLAREFDRRLTEWAMAQGCKVIASGTPRNAKAFMRRFPGLTLYGATFIRVLEESDAQRAAENRTDDQRPVPLPN